MVYSTPALVALAFVAAAADPLLPALGNEGYDVQSYHLAYDFQPGTTALEGTSTMVARTTRRLDSFAMDFAGGSVRAVVVDGRPAEHRVEEGKLVVTPARATSRGTFQVTTRYTADRAAKVPSPVDETAGWSNDPDGGFAWFGQPDRAHLFFPCNDDLADKVRFTYRVTVPDGWSAIANGGLRSQRSSAGRTTFVYASRSPMATQLAQLAVGKFDIVTGTGPHGLPLRSAVPAGQGEAARATIDRVPQHLAWLEERTGRRYPFDTLGLLGVAGSSPMQTFALETQALPIFSARDLTDPASSQMVVHELAHQWFGTSAGMKTWSDIWLSEGFASYYDRLWNAEHGGPSLDEPMRGAYTVDRRLRESGVTPARPGDPAMMFGAGRATGPLVVYALHEKVGEAKFREIVQAYFDRYRNSSASSADFTAVAVEIGGGELAAFLEAWLYGPTTPQMPGHPDW